MSHFPPLHVSAIWNPMHLSRPSSICLQWKEFSFCSGVGAGSGWGWEVVIAMPLGSKLRQIFYSNFLGWFLKLESLTLSFHQMGFIVLHTVAESRRNVTIAVVTATQHPFLLPGITLQLYFDTSAKRLSVKVTCLSWPSGGHVTRVRPVRSSTPGS